VLRLQIQFVQGRRVCSGSLNGDGRCCGCGLTQFDVLDEAAAVDREVRTMVEKWHEEVISDLDRGMQLAGRFTEERRHIRGTLAFTSLDYVATLWTRRKLGPNREHALEVLADSWYHLLCDEG
jgi:hypothetical protein